jgi:outer membrane lipoprotein SlyB
MQYLQNAKNDIGSLFTFPLYVTTMHLFIGWEGTMIQTARYGTVCLAILLLAGCTRQIGSHMYSESHVGEASSSYQGTILSVRKVLVGSERLQDNVVGGAIVAVSGGLLGSAFGQGHGRTAMTAAGAIGGAVAGAAAERALKEQEAIEYTVKLNTGKILTVVQGLEDPLPAGSRVIVIVGKAGRSRVVRDTTGA